MKQTVLEEYVAIISVLAKQGPLKPIQLEAFIHINSITLRKYLVFLTEQGAIKKQSSKKPIAYSITPYGEGILSFFGLGKSMKLTKIA